jgi:hypothetical protein
LTHGHVIACGGSQAEGERMAESDQRTQEKTKTCFVVMPISDVAPYPTGHFSRVYEYIIKPACEAAGYQSLRADDVASANFIVLDILHRIINSDLVVCDLSARNPNVLCELGLRQAFDRPVVLMKDSLTDRIFDIQGFRTLDYNEALRVDTVQQDIRNLVAAIGATAAPAAHEVNSLVGLLGIEKAEVKERAQISDDTALVLSAIKDLGQRLSRVEERERGSGSWRSAVVLPPEMEVMEKADLLARHFSIGKIMRLPEPVELTLPSGETAKAGAVIYGSEGALGKLVSVSDRYVVLRNSSGHIDYYDKQAALAQQMTAEPKSVL